jgi:DNA repair ATPase RecN
MLSCCAAHSQLILQAHHLQVSSRRDHIETMRQATIAYEYACMMEKRTSVLQKEVVLLKHQINNKSGLCTEAKLSLADAHNKLGIVQAELVTVDTEKRAAVQLLNACTEAKLWCADAHDKLQDMHGQLPTGNTEKQDAVQRMIALTVDLQSTRQQLHSMALKDAALKALRTELDAAVDEIIQLKQHIATRDEEIASLESGTYGWEE